MTEPPPASQSRDHEPDPSGISQEVSFVIWDNMTVEELQRNASTLQEGSLILLLNYNRDRVWKSSDP